MVRSQITRSAPRVGERAETSDGYQFERWGGDISGSENPKTITMTSDKHITASFESVGPEQVTLTIEVFPAGSGTVGMTLSKQVAVDKGEIVNIQAPPNEGWEFDYWSGDVTGTDPFLRVTMDSDKTAIANFRKELAGQVSESLPLLMMIIGGIMVPVGLVVAGRAWPGLSEIPSLNRPPDPAQRFQGVSAFNAVQIIKQRVDYRCFNM